MAADLTANGVAMPAEACGEGSPLALVEIAIGLKEDLAQISLECARVHTQTEFVLHAD
jgi:hypothetical protein